MANFDPLMAKIIGGFGAPQQISTVFESWLCYCSDVVHRRPTKLCTMFGRLLEWYTIYTFFGAWRNFARCKIYFASKSCVILCGSITARHSTCGRQPNFAARYNEWNYGTFADGAIYIRLGGHHVGHRPTFQFFPILGVFLLSTVKTPVRMLTKICEQMRWIRHKKYTSRAFFQKTPFEDSFRLDFENCRRKIRLNVGMLSAE